jgi:outer membrane protein OmpA-like peptidoglycan-associated protein
MSKMRLNKQLKWMSAGLMAAYLVGCAAQSIEKAQRAAEHKVLEAQLANMNAPGTHEAFDKLNEGKKYLAEARYDQAMRSFKQSAAASDAVLAGNVTYLNPSAEATPAPTPVPQSSTPVMTAPTPVRTAPVNKSAADSREKKGMPAKALAKYLAAKKASAPPPVAAKTEPAPKAAGKVAKHSAPTPTPSQSSAVPQTEPAPQPEPTQEPAVAPAPTPAPTPTSSPESLAKKIENDAVVVAPAKPSLKKIPTVNEKEEVDQEAVGKVAEPKKMEMEKPEPAKAGELAKRKIPGMVPFSINDPSVQADAIAYLDQTSKFLLDNPSTTLILQGHLGPGESSTLVDARFESMRSYLTGKGVPDDQIRLDTDRKSSKVPEFQMFLIEH